MSFFKLAIKTNVVLTMGSPYTMNFMTWLWRSLFFSQVVARLMLASIVMVQVLDSFEYKRCFNNLN
jgi:hypothetical protein